MSERRSRGVFLLEALVSLAILGIVLTLGASFLARRRALEKDRLDRERAVRALASEWIYLRTSFRNDVYPSDRRPFVGPGDFVDALDSRNPFLKVKSTDVDGLCFVRLEIRYGEKMSRQIVQEGYVFRGAGPPPP
ncbi:MAG TPA: prepilin-type N-terminal cleavage/methylation domain-containing protein [Thermoanaerobaculia bacterium]|nr:prepilin-type N-terminal cleavage/methylation domain-containing protein [Thermoanaerobaculia bacterium]